MFELLATEKQARRGRLTTVHGTVQTPLFMNVATSAAIKGAASSMDLRDVGCQIELCNTYHLHIRPGDELIRDLGGLRAFMGWDGPVLTDSGGFQVFSLAALRKIREEGVYFQSHVDGRHIFMGPEESMRIQSNLGSTIAMAFDECIESPAPHDYTEKSCERTYRWLLRCAQELERLNSQPGVINPRQILFGINQGATYTDLRVRHMRQIAALDLPGYAIGGLAVGESHEEMYRVVEEVAPHMPVNKPRYLMGVGTPINILEAVSRGIDLFDCVIATRNARHANLYTNFGYMNLNNKKFERDTLPIEPGCGCHTCQNFSRAYIRHLFKSGEMLGMRLCVLHNLYFYNKLMADIREAVDAGKYAQFMAEKIVCFDQRI